MAEKECVVLDTSAILALFADEPGADLVEETLKKARKSQVEVFVSFATLAETYYTISRRRTPAQAREAVATLKALSLQIVYPDERMTLAAARFKAQGGLSFADAFVAALAADKNAFLVHKDPELEALCGQIKTRCLPLK